VQNFFRFLFLFFLFEEFAYSKAEKIEVGTIASEYQNTLSKERLIALLKEVEQTFEKQIGLNVFDYAHGGKPINILYIDKSKRKITITKKLSDVDVLQQKIDIQQTLFTSKQEEILQKEVEINLLNKNLNDKILQHNKYIEEENQKQHTKEEYEVVKKYIQTIQKEIAQEKNIYRQKMTKLDTLINQYNQTITTFNMMINQYNRLQREIENLSKGFQEVKGAAIGKREIIYKTSFKDGVVHKEKIVTQSMDKIEIYGFTSLDELKVVLAHEIGHLVGVDHIEKEEALMNPILQKNQIKNLQLTQFDILKFRETLSLKE